MSAQRRTCPECGRYVLVTRNGGFRGHYSEAELRVVPYMRRQCAGSGRLVDAPVPPKPPEVKRVEGTPLHYRQTEEGWTYSLLIPTGSEPTHRMFKEAFALELLSLERAVRSGNAYVWIKQCLANLDYLREQEASDGA